VHSFALDYYWIGKGVNSNWSLPGNWATTSGATVSDVQVPPALTDNVIFDENSFTTANKTVTVNTASTCDSIIFRNIQADRIPTLTVNAGLTVNGSMFLVAGMTVNGSSSQTIQFQSVRTDETLAVDGVTYILPSLVFTGSTNWTIDGSLSGVGMMSTFTFSSTGNLTVNGNLTAFQITFSGGGDMIVGSYVSTSSFAFSGNGNLIVNGYLKASSISGTVYLYNNRSVYLGGTGTKTIKGDLTAYAGICAEGGTVDIQGDLIMNTYNSISAYPTNLTGGNPSVSGGCKMTIGGNIVNNNANAATGVGGGRFSVSDAGTEVEVKGGYATLYDLYIRTGGKLLGLTETVQCNGGWYSGGVVFTAATAPKLIRIGTGDLIANATDVYNDVEFYGVPATQYITKANYHAINRGTYNSVTFMKGSGIISTVTTNRLIIYPQAEYLFSNTTTVNNYLEIKPRPCGGMIQVTGGTIAMVAGSTVVAENLLLQNNTITGATPYTAINSGDRGGNTGWNFSEIPNTWYWVGGTGNWGDINHWASASGGAAGSGCIPSLFDNVVFNGASGLSGTATVTVLDSIYSYCNNMTWNGVTGTPTLNLGASIARLYIGGSLELSKGMKITNPGSINATDDRGIHFVSNRNTPYETITTNGVAIPGNVYFYSGEVVTGGSGGWIFQDNWTGNAYIYFQQGSLNFNGKAVAATWFNSNNSLTRTLDIAGSTVTMYYYWIYFGTGSNVMTNTLTDNSLIKVTNGGGLTVNYGFYAKAGDQYNNVEFTTTGTTAGTRTIYNGTFNKITLLGNNIGATYSPILDGTIVTDSLILAAKIGATYTLNTNITVNKYLQGPQDCGLMSELASNNTVVKTITMGAAGISSENVKMKNMKITRVNIDGGPKPAEGYPAPDSELGTNAETGWNAYASAGTKRYYWVGGTGNWSDVSHWSDESGGTGGAFCNPPRPANTVVFDANSFKANNCVVTIDAVATCDSMLWTGTISETPTLSMGANLTVSGSMLLQQNMKTAYYNGTTGRIITFNSTRLEESLKTSGVSLSSSVTFYVKGEWDIPDGFSCSSIVFGGPSGSIPKWVIKGALKGGTTNFNRGILDLSGQTVSIGSFTYSSTSTDVDLARELIIKDATIAVSNGNWSYNGILTAANSLNSVINFFRNDGNNPITMTTVANQVYSDVNFSTGAYAYPCTITAPAGANTTQFRKVTFASTGTGTTNNGKFEYLYFKSNGTINTIETDTLRFNNNSSNLVYTFTSGATSTINKKWYGSGLPCFQIKIQSSVNGTPAYVNVKKEAATIHDPQDALYLDYIYVSGIIARQGTDLALLEKGFGSPENITLSGRTYNTMTPAQGWIMDTYYPVLNPLPNMTIPCDAFPYIIDPVQFVTTPESTYEWRRGGPNGTALNQGNPDQSTWTITDASESGVYYLKVDYHPEGTTCVLDGIANVSVVAADSLIWTGKASKDWNNAQNWQLPDGGGVATDAPTVCTNVLIPAGLTTVYPDLSPGNTDYTQEYYETAACNNIWFEHGGEVAYPDLLTYSEANVELQVNANRWYMFSAPLQQFYTGDIYLTEPCPYDDGVAIYTQLYNAINPQTLQTLSEGATWTGNFNTASHLLKPGDGVSIWADDGSEIDQTANVLMPQAVQDKQTGMFNGFGFWFPKQDTCYRYYFQGTPDPTGRQTEYLDKTYSHRFIFESGSCTRNASTGDITMPITASGSDMIIVGNPFMSHLDMKKFFAANSEKIESEYKVIQGFHPEYKGDFPPFLTYYQNETTELVSDPSLDHLIAPMQSIILTAKKDFTELTFNGNMTVTSPGNKLKVSNLPEVVTITASMGNQTNRTSLIYSPGASSSFVPGEDSYKLYTEKMDDYSNDKPLVLYTSSSDGFPLEVNTFGNTDESIKLGIRTSLTGEIKLDFSGMESFISGKNIFLRDLGKGIDANLKQTPFYTFTKDLSDVDLKDRFLLVFSSATGLDNAKQGSAIVIYTDGDRVQVVSNNDLLKSVQVFDLQGSLLQGTSPLTKTFSTTIDHQGVYVIKAQSESSSEVRKISIGQ